MEFDVITYALGHIFGGLLVLYAAGRWDRWRGRRLEDDAGPAMLFAFWPIIVPFLVWLWVFTFLTRHAYRLGRGQ